MTAFNTAAYLVEALESVLQQKSGCRWELIFVDDGSTDATLQIAKEYQARYPDLLLVLQHAGGLNCGISASRNLALSHARADLIAFIDSDDVWLPDHLETLTSVLQRVPQAAAVWAGAERWVDHAAPFNEARARAAWWGSNYLPPLVPAGETTGLLRPGTLLRWFLKDESKVPCICSMVVRADAARAVGGFVDDFRGLYDDQAFHAKLSLNFAIYALDVCVARYRQHTASCCATDGRNHALRNVEHARFVTFVEEYCRHAQRVSQPTARSSPEPVCP